MKRLLVATDFSNNAFNALLYTTQLFKNEKCKFLLLHSFGQEISTLTSRVDIGKREELFDKLLEDSQNRFVALQSSIEKANSSTIHSYECISTSMSLTKKVNELILTNELDMVVMGAIGATESSDIFLGSNSVRIIEKITRCPLLIIPKGLVFSTPKIVAFPTDFKHRYNGSVLKAFKMVTSCYNPTIKVLHIKEEDNLSESQRINFKNLTKLLRDTENEIYWIPKSSNKVQLIHEFIEEFDVDILMMVFYKNNFFKRLTHEQVIKKTAFQAVIPLMVIPDQV